MNLYNLNLEDRTKERKRIFEEINQRDSLLISFIIQEKFKLEPSPKIRILDFGCGKGKMVNYLYSLGFNANGCDITPAWEDGQDTTSGRCSIITMNPYRLPYQDDSFDLVFSTSVLEHAQNTEEIFREIYRVLRNGGISMHNYPSKWYLPSEPHTLIPFANFFWPNCPNWWIGLWVLIRVAFIPKLAPNWKDMYHRYCEFCKTGSIYLSNSTYKAISMRIFGNYYSLMDFYIERAEGGLARLARKLRLRKLAGWFSSNFRMNFIYQCKSLET
jgi:SAM-dependent methyltransferase